MADTAPRRPRTPRLATVLRTSRPTPHLVRVVLGGEGLAGFAPGYTDAYVKLVLPPAGAPYAAPFDMDAVQREHPRELWPCLRTYTVRAWDRAAGELVLDVVVHGDEGLAGPWAVAARPGDRVQLLGPGGAYAPSGDVDWHLLAGDETALPAIAASLERLPARAAARVFVEVADAAEEQPLPAPEGVEVRWLHRGGTPPGEGTLLVDAVAALERPEGEDLFAWVAAESATVRAVRADLRGRWGLSRAQHHAIGYWRRGRAMAPAG